MPIRSSALHRSRRASGVVQADVKRIRIKGDGGEVVLDRDVQGEKVRWVAPEHGLQEVPRQVVEEPARVIFAGVIDRDNFKIGVVLIQQGNQAGFQIALLVAGRNTNRDPGRFR